MKYEGVTSETLIITTHFTFIYNVALHVVSLFFIPSGFIIRCHGPLGFASHLPIRLGGRASGRGTTGG